MIYQYSLRFSSATHFGLEGIGQERVEQRLRSDTLWGAIIQKWLLLFNDDADTLCCKPPFHLSSAFPVIGGVSFFPLPMGALDDLITQAAMSDKPVIEVKELKKIRFLAEPLFNKAIAGKALSFADLQKEMTFPSPGGSGCREERKKTAFSTVQRPRLEVDRLRGGGVEGQFFYCTDQFFHEDGGLFFLASFDDDTARDKFEAALRLLADSGVGADRSIGRGTFDFHVGEYRLPKNGKPDAYLLLSLYHPGKDEVEQGILDAPTAYSLAKRYGHAASHLTTGFRRHDLWMLEEGSILGRKPAGDVCLVLARSEEFKIPHNVYRNGRAFYIPMVRPAGEV